MYQTNSNDQAPQTVSTPCGEFSKKFLNLSREIKEDKLRFLALFSEMQRSYLVNVAKEPPLDEHLNEIQDDLWYLENLILNA